MSDDKFISRRIRPEARPLNWMQLNASQKEAFRRVLYTMEETITSFPNGESGQSLRGELLQPNRASTAAFISGHRGSGKSSVMLSLMRQGLKQSGVDTRAIAL